MTYEELIELGLSGDPIIDPALPAQITPEGLFIPGTVDGGNVLDMLIKIEDGGLRAWVRDCEGEFEPFLGKEWCEEAFFEKYEDLVTWAYAW